MSLNNAHDLYPALKQVLGLPDHLIWCELRIAANEIVTMRCEYYPAMANGDVDVMGTVLRKYELVPIGEGATPNPSPAPAPPEMVTAQAEQSLWRSRWWLRQRHVTPVLLAGGQWTACQEFYVPWWAWPLEVLHRAAFGRAEPAQ